jgi:hypothetical protein
VEIGDIKRFETFYGLNSFAGLLPMEHSSLQSCEGERLKKPFNLSLSKENK